MLTSTTRRLLAAAVLVVATAATATAQMRGRSVVPPFAAVVSGSSVTGTVTSTVGPLALLDGQVTLDLSDTKVVGDSITPGVVVFAVLKSGDVAANAPLPVAYLFVTRQPQLLTGPVTAVDLTARTLTLLGRTIKTDGQTIFGSNFPTFKAVELSDILPKSLVQVDVTVSGNALLARSVRILTFSPPSLPTVVHGAVKSISSGSWIITANGKDVLVLIGDQTKIDRNISIGDIVDAVVDQSNTAIIIVLRGHQGQLSGTVKSIAPTQWVIALGPPISGGGDSTVEVNANTKITGDPKVGDHVIVHGEMAVNGPFVATSIDKLP